MPDCSPRCLFVSRLSTRTAHLRLKHIFHRITCIPGWRGHRSVATTSVSSGTHQVNNAGLSWTAALGQSPRWDTRAEQTRQRSTCRPKRDHFTRKPTSIVLPAYPQLATLSHARVLSLSLSLSLARLLALFLSRALSRAL
ncbi:unnamed protein product [Protopolystoma xenopodis]|uniref:Uncharacterized protein n=1 Tax=Protopolystoma xenopodis TaxID=117903 RepID=A0A3S5B501_9PLAT|nr:unnamed protein product [Protopolystoma xenopodis]